MAEEPESRYAALAEEGEHGVALEAEPEPTTLERLAAEFEGAIEATSNRLGEATATVEAAHLLDVMGWLRDEAGFALLSDVTAHDCHGQATTGPRFFVVYHMLNLDAPERLRVKVGLPEKKPVVDSVVPLWPGADYLEREVYDLFGIEFKNHPNLKRIMLPEEWEGHPLRKDFPVVYEEVQFTHNAAEIAARKPFAQR